LERILEKVGGPRCVACNLDRILDKHAHEGVYTVKLAVQVGESGIVQSAVAIGAPTPEIKSRIEEQAEQWVFEPYSKNALMNGKLNFTAHVAVVKPSINVHR
jgi:hypothetical protein